MTDYIGDPLRAQVLQVKGQINLRQLKKPYLGSVRFFKHLIISFVIIMMTVPWVLVISKALAGRQLSGELVSMEARLAEAIQVATDAAVAGQELEKDAMEHYERYEALLVQAENDLQEFQTAYSFLETQMEVTEALYDFSSSFSHLHPELKVAGPSQYIDSERTVYLTFDDGPSSYTRSILDVLRRYDIKATFFVVGYTIPGREAILQQMVEEGHNIGVHTYSHVYREIYGSMEAFLDDFAKASNMIEEVTGIKPDVFRFPGGSVNSYNERWGNMIISEMLSRGYRYYDWNVGSGDASLDANSTTIYEAVIRQVRANDYSVVLMHDGGGNRSTTVTALSMVIDRLRNEGYTFDKLTNEVRPTVFAAAGFNRG